MHNSFCVFFWFNTLDRFAQKVLVLTFEEKLWKQNKSGRKARDYPKSRKYYCKRELNGY